MSMNRTRRVREHAKRTQTLAQRRRILNASLGVRRRAPDESHAAHEPELAALQSLVGFGTSP
jgi:uncharacterized protein YlxW (UPF0749 family)